MLHKQTFVLGTAVNQHVSRLLKEPVSRLKNHSYPDRRGSSSRATAEVV